MTAITITPRNKKELMALKHFIKALDLTYEETTPVLKGDNSSIKPSSKTPKEFENCITIDEFSSKTTSFLESLSWNK